MAVARHFALQAVPESGDEDCAWIRSNKILHMKVRAEMGTVLKQFETLENFVHCPFSSLDHIVKDTDDFTLPPGDRTKEAGTTNSCNKINESQGLSWVKSYCNLCLICWMQSLVAFQKRFRLR